MSNVIRSLMVKVGADTREFQAKMKNISGDLKKTGREMQKMGQSLTRGLTLPIVGAGAAAFKFASDYEEAMNKVDVSFGNNADEVVKWSKTTLKQFGLAQGTALDMAALFGDMATGMGINTKEAAGMSTQLVGLAGDLASFKNIGIDQASTALKSIFTGETESLKNLGIVMTQTNLDAFALAEGFNKTTKEMTEAEKINLRLAFVMDRTKNSQGDFARTNDGAANQMRIFTESLKELAATFGNVLLPMITPIIQKVNAAIQKFASMDDGTKKLIVTVGLFVAAIGPTLSLLGGLITNTGKVVGAFGKFSKAMTGGSTLLKGLGVLISPTGAIILGMVAFAGAAYTVYENWDKIKEAVGGATKKVKEFFTVDKKAEKTYDMTGLAGGNQSKYGTAFANAQSNTYKPYAKGTNYVPETGLALLHKGEAVIPAKQNKPGLVNHTGTITVKGVNDKNELIAVMEKVISNNILQSDRRLPNRASLLPL